MPKVHLLDYAAGNIRSLVNAIEKLGWEVEWIESPADVANAEVCYLTLYKIVFWMLIADRHTLCRS